MGLWGFGKKALNSTIGSDMQPLDEMLMNRVNGGTQTFTANGTFIVPTGVTKIWVTACAGGQGAGASAGSNGSTSGDGGDWIIKQPYNVTPGQSISITVGQGGAAGIEPANGGNTVIGSLVTLVGGGASGNIRGGKAGSYTLSDGQNGYATGGKTFGTTDIAYGGGGSLGRGADGNQSNCYLGGGGGGTTAFNEQGSSGANGIVIIEW